MENSRSSSKKKSVVSVSSPGLSGLRKKLVSKSLGKISTRTQRTRPALSSLQNSGTPGENEMVGRSKVVTGSRKTSDNNNGKTGKTPDRSGSSPKPTTTNKVRNGSITKRKYADKGIQTLNPDVELITGDEPPLIYWKELAETRRLALEEALQENQTLHERVDDLEKENRALEEIVEDAKRIAEIFSSIPDDDNDESGIGQDSEDTGYDHDLSSSSP